MELQTENNQEAAALQTPSAKAAPTSPAGAAEQPVRTAAPMPAGINPEQPPRRPRPAGQAPGANPEQPQRRPRPAGQAPGANPEQPQRRPRPAGQTPGANPEQLQRRPRPAGQTPGASPDQPQRRPRPAGQAAGQPPRRPAGQGAAKAPAAPKPAKKPWTRKPVPAFVRVIVSIISLVLVLAMGVTLICSTGGSTGTGKTEVSNVSILEKFESYVTNRISASLDGILAIKKQYWLSDSDLIAPRPNPEGYGTAASPAELKWLMDKAVETFGGAPLQLTEDSVVWDQYPIHYYYDETILTVAWKEVIDDCVYTFSEIKIAHPSQFRRFLAGGSFGSDKQYTTTDMAASVNAVLASSGDFYKFRRYGAVVYQGQLQRFEGHYVDTCFIDDNGDLLFKYRDELKTEAEAKQFIEDNNIRFSLAFGPVVIENGESKVPTNVYALGEIKNRFTRTVLCQMGQLHYMLVNVGGDPPYDNRHKLTLLAENLLERGVPKAYSLDGGQTAAIAMDGQLVNRPDYGTERKHSDIIYFATAIPEGG